MDAICENNKANMTTNRMDKAYEIIKRLSRVPKLRSRIVKDKNGLLVIDKSKIVKRWKEYIEDLYNGSIK